MKALLGVTLPCILWIPEASSQVFNMVNGATWESCTGSIYDSGGSAAAYGNNENLTAVLCPTGGAGGGPVTGITFTVWTVAAGDQLVIHDGSSAAAPVLATGTSTTSLLSQSFTSTDPSGCLTFVWTSNATGVAAGWAATITTGPDAGTDGALTICSNAAPVGLFDSLNGTPDAGGAWTLNGDPISATYTPNTSAPGNYVYTVNGVPPCGSATAQVIVTEVQAPNAGGNRSITVCSNEAPFSMRSRLLGSPDAGGTWSGGHSDTFDPATEGSSSFTYTVLGTAPCAQAQATLTITVRQAPKAGTGGPVVLCSNNATVDLFTRLGGTPDGGGTWSGPGGAHNGLFVPGTDPPGAYTYTVTGQAPCTPATAVLNITVNPAPNAGTNAAVVRCSNNAAFDMRAQLGGTPNVGGTWVGPNGAHGNSFDPATDTPGLYTYTVTGLAPCAPASASLQISVITAPNAGTNGNHVVCSTDGQFSLFSRLGGTPNGGGAWTGPSTVTGGLFDPAVNVEGIYTYTVPGTSPCVNATATVTVDVVPASNAGTAGSLTVCSDGAPQALFGQLGGTPQGGGTWTPPPGGSGFTGTYDPAAPNHPAGNYLYTVAGVTPCPAVSAVVQVVEHLAPRAGTDGTITVCSTNGPFNLFTALGGNPHTGGTWRNATNATVSETFVPGTTPAGVYRYVVVGIAPCVNDTSMVTVVVNQAPVAGTNGSTQVCSDNAPFDLTPLLGGTPDAGGTWRDPSNVVIPSGQYDPAVHETGAYTYTVQGLTPCVNATALVNVTERRKPVAGSSATLEVCSTAGPVDLFTILGGTPDAGGVWTAPTPGAFSGIFIPGTSAPGTYTYTVSGQSPCTPAVATVLVTVNAAPNAGTSGAITVCADQSSVDLFDGLGGSPDNTGTWSGSVPPGHLSGSFFSPAGLPPGDYTFNYQVPANGSCAAANSSVVVTIAPVLDAGNNGMANRCGSETAVNLFNILGGTPQTGGQWIDLGNTGQLTGQYFNAQNAGAGTYQFRYRIQGTLSCSSDSAQVTLTVVAAPDAGGNGTKNFCDNEPGQSLFPFLTGSPSGGGIWRRPPPGSQVFNGNYVPATFSPGVYSYTVNGTPPCANAVATVTVTETPAPNVGTMTPPVEVCSDDAPFNMTAELNGNPATNGTWSFSGTPGQSHSSTFVPGQDAPGVWIYTVPGTFPCSDRTNSLTINVRTAPFAGNDGSITVCSTDAPFLLFSVLGGTPDGGGTWRDPSNQPFPSGIFTPGTSPEGVYRYKVNGQGACGPDEATVEVFVTDAANAGIPGNANLCAGGPSVNLIAYLGGNPDPTGSWTGPSPSTAFFSGNFQPGISQPGVYTYTVVGVAPCADRSASVTVTVTSPPNAGTSTSITKCSNEPAFQLVTVLGGSPALNGTWTYPPGSMEIPTGIFTPGTSLPGVYTYTVAGTAPCAAAVSTVTVSVNQAPRAGTNGNAILCSNSGPTPLFPFLGGNPQAGGTWTRPVNVGHSGTFQPLTDPAVVYTYTVAGITPCLNSTATVTVTVNPAPNAGSNGIRTICSTDPPFALRDVLVGAPQNGGVWTITGTPTVVSDIYSPANFPNGGVHTYTYTVAGGTGCSNSTAQVTIIQNMAAQAGGNGSLTICSDAAEVDLFDLLSGNPDQDGSWYNSTGDPVGNLFIPGDHTAGEHAFRYLVLGDAPCANDTATVTVTMRRKPQAGFSTAPLICSDASSFALVGLLGGTPDFNGTWVFQPSVGPPMVHNGVYDPSINGSGAYVYTVLGESPCANATATVQLTVVPGPDAGANGALSACVVDNDVVLFNGLQGTPQPGGSWTGNVPPAALVNGHFNATLVPPGEYVFTYTRTGNNPCLPATATVTVTVTEALDAGIDATAEACRTQNLLDLFPLLGGSPQPGGVWSGAVPSGSLSGGIFSPSTAGTGTYLLRYILPGSTGCPADTSFVTVHVLNGPRAGDDAPLSICSSSSAVDLFASLGGLFDLNGTWFGPPPGNVQLAGSLFDPAVDPPGAYRYVVPAIGSCPADESVVTVTVTPAVNAGLGADLAFCVNGNARNMGEALTGNPDPGGIWYLGHPSNNVPHSAIYDPALDNPGQYYYVVEAQSPCATQFAIVVVTEQAAPNAGGSNTYATCSDAAPFSMRAQLTGTPQNTGTWYFGQPPVVHPNAFNPGVDVSGVYTYIVNGIGPCVNDSAFLTVNVTTAPNAGANANLNVCATEDTVDLFQALGPNADSTGVWTDASSNPVDSLFHPDQVPPDTYVFTYTVPGTGPCAPDISTVTVTVGSGLDPGIGGNDTICGGLDVYDLFNSLEGSPDPGGVWSEASFGPLSGSTFNPSTWGAGPDLIFQYTLQDPNCGTVSSVVQLHMAPYPDPGTSTDLTACSNGSVVDLFTLLGEDAQPGGQWSTPGGGDGDGFFDPATEPEGTYTYALPGTEFCASVSASIEVVVNAPPNAGPDGAAQACSTDPALDLQPLLSGAPAGGVWHDPIATGALSGNSLNTTLLPAGGYGFLYVLSAEGCQADTAQLELTVAEGVLVDEVQLICNEQDRTYTVLITVVGGESSTWTVNGLEGTFEDGLFTSAPIFTSQDFSAMVDDGNHCTPQLVQGSSPCDFEEEVFVPQSFSPNGDGINEAFTIPGIEGFPENQVTIFNRWGGEVYSAAGYDNRTIVWDGTSEKATIPGPLPTGTYYYVLELGDGRPPLKGYVYLNR
ncbi:MAG TPA: gliding motility-associated C-terminal domain-containing protein [Flavobacteriales bacterium]